MSVQGPSTVQQGRPKQVARRPRGRRRTWAAALALGATVVAALAVLLVRSGGESAESPSSLPTAPETRPTGQMQPSRPYADSSPWNTPIRPDVEVAENSTELITALAAAGDPLTSDVDQYTIPVYEVDGETPRRTVHLSGFFSSYLNGDNSREGHGEAPTISDVPVPAGATAAAGTDGQIVLLDRENGLEYGFWQWEEDEDGRISATNGYVYGTGRGNYGRFADGLAGRGAGLPYFAGLVRPWEVEQGRIDHALAFAYEWPSPEFVYPASKSDGLGEPHVDLPEGTRLQLDPSLTEGELRELGLSPEAIVIAKALQEYGMYVVDNSGSSKVYLEDRMTAGWGPQVHRDMLAPIPWSSFRVVEPPQLDPVAQRIQ